MKKLYIFVVLALLAISSAVSAQTCDCEGLQAQIDALTARIEALEGKAPSAASQSVSADETASEVPAVVSIGDFEQVVVKDYTLDYLGYEMAKNYEGKDYVRIKFHYTNNSNESESYMWAVSTTAFQDGIELKEAYIDDSERGTEIRPGKSIDIIEAFYLRSLTTPIELEFDVWMSWDDTYKTIRFINID